MHTQDLHHPCKNEYCLSFNKYGLQKLRKTAKCHKHNSNTFLKKKKEDTPCEEYHKVFCRKMEKLNHKLHSHMPLMVRHICKLLKPL